MHPTCSRWLAWGAGALVALAPGAARPAASDLSPAAALAITDAFHSGRRAAADSLLAAWEATQPGDPLVALVRVELAWWDVLEGRDVDGGREREFEAALAAIEARAARQLRSAGDRDDDAPVLWALGEAHCAAGRLAGLRGQAWAALRHHQRGVDALERVRALRPAAPEPGASLGVFHYYAARLPLAVRALARLVRVRGDRAGGLRELRAAAAAPGLQQLAGRFFLVQILNDNESENWEALEHALRARAAAPARLAVVLKLADVLADLERPDLAVALLERAAPPGDGCAAAQCAFLAGRVECDSGRAAAALARFESLGRADVDRVAWLAPWWETYRGAACAALGDEAAARRHWRRAAALPDVAGSRAAARQLAARSASPRERARLAAEAALQWRGDVSEARARLAAARAAAPQEAASDAPFELACGRAALRAGAAGEAVAAFARAARAAGAADPGLAAAARGRWLQALLWAGDHDAARAAAAAMRRSDAAAGAPRALGWLVESCLDPAPPVFDAGAPDAAGAPVRVQLADTGFTSVDVEIEGRAPRPLQYRDGFWTGTVQLPTGRTRYRFRVEGRHPILDPESAELDDVQGTPWSVRRVAGATS
jgi:hypothetical protein